MVGSAKQQTRPVTCVRPTCTNTGKSASRFGEARRVCWLRFQEPSAIPAKSVAFEIPGFFQGAEGTLWSICSYAPLTFAIRAG